LPSFTPSFHISVKSFTALEKGNFQFRRACGHHRIIFWLLLSMKKLKYFWFRKKITDRTYTNEKSARHASNQSNFMIAIWHLESKIIIKKRNCDTQERE
jgi:hypothetical protein